MPLSIRDHLLPTLATHDSLVATRNALITLTDHYQMGHDVLASKLHDHWLKWLVDVNNSTPLIHGLLGVSEDSLTPTKVSPVISTSRLTLPHVQHVQLSLSTTLERIDQARFVTKLTHIHDDYERKNTLARYHSQSGPGAMAFLSGLPSHEQGFTMPHHHFREACRRDLDIHRPQTPEALCYKCSELATAEHARRCACTGFPTLRHHLVRDNIADGLRMMGLLGVHTEQSAPFAACDEPDLRMDITIEGGQGLHAKHINNVTDDMDRGVLLDVKLTDPTCLTSVTGASKQHAHAADAIAKRNHKHYDKYIDADKYVLVPLAFEVFGGACKEVHNFISTVAQYKVGHGDSTWTRSRVIDWWRKRISFAVQSSTSIAVDACLRRARPNTGYNLYTHMSLLRPLHNTPSTP